jgi:hypothetical protein
MLSMLLPPLPHAARPLDLLDRDMPEVFEWVADRDFDPLWLVALFNFDDEAKDLAHALPDGRWHAFEVWSQRYLGVIEGRVEFALVEAHGCRLVAMRPVTSRPALVGTTAHVGCGALDITHIAWEEPRLTIDVAPAGRRDRRLVVGASGRMLDDARRDGAPIAFEAAAQTVIVPLSVDEPATIELTFGA